MHYREFLRNIMSVADICEDRETIDMQWAFLAATLDLYFCQRGADKNGAWSSTGSRKKLAKNLTGVPLGSRFGAIPMQTSVGMSRVSNRTTRLFISEGMGHFSTYLHKIMQVTSINKLTMFKRSLSTRHHDDPQRARGDLRSITARRTDQRDVSLDASSETRGTLMH